MGDMRGTTIKSIAELEWREKFIAALARLGNVTAACDKAKISRSQVYRVRDEDAEFAAAWDEALEEATERLEAEARRRAEKGTLEPIFHKGEKVGSVRRYSDTLMIFLLKAHRPDKYRDNHRIEHTGADGGPIETNSKAQVIVKLPDNGRSDRDSN